MKQNSLIEIGSKADVIIGFITDTTINGQTYKKNEPYLLLKDVGVGIEYAAKEGVATKTPQNLAAYSLINPTAVYINGASFSRKVASLLTSFQGAKNFGIRAFETTQAFDGTIYLSSPLAALDDIFVYNTDMQKIDDFAADLDSSSITSLSFVDEDSYLISFSTVKTGSKFNLSKPNIPYMFMEIHGTGNIDKKTSNVYIKLDKVSLESTLEFHFFRDGIINAPLKFNILEKENELYFEV